MTIKTYAVAPASAFFTGLLLLVAHCPAFAQQSAPVEAQGAWARATPPHASTGAIYLTLTSPTGDRLTGASSPDSSKAGVHDMRMDGNVMRMRPVEGGLDLPAGKPVTLAPGGYHIMLEDLKAPLTPGQAVPVHLTFQKAPPLDIEAQVQAIGAPGPNAASTRRAGQGAMPGMTMGK